VSRNIIMTPSTFVTARALLLRFGLAVMIVFLFVLLSRAGGPKYVAGTSYFESAATGQPLTWTQGVVTYYTDQGDLSPILPNAAANTFVANAFSQWTAVSTAALNISSGGQLAEDVNGTNVYVNSNGTITMPADIEPSATDTPVGIVYDYDGSVTDALLGSGAGDSSQCFFNAVYGGDDNYGPTASYLHALIVINGQCALESSQLVDVEYRLVRVIGSVLGVGWSQLNLNVITGTPTPTDADYAGFPVMHYTDPVTCVPITNCYTNPYQLAPDDTAALSRLYPVTAQTQPDYPGSQVFSSTTGRIYGSVWFTDPAGNPTQPMQGVNVVARWIDPTTGLPSDQYSISSVSGFLFTGNAGNPITGFNDPAGDAYSEWGSTSSTLEGFFDLGGLPLPNGGSGQFELTVEPLDPTWSVGVGPYAPLLVAPSGLAQPITVTIAVGQEVEQDILMTDSGQPIAAPPVSWTVPAAMPPTGRWLGSLSGYGDMEYLLLPVQSNRTFSVAVMALDEADLASESKAQPVIGLWSASDPQGTAPPAFTPSPFNTPVDGLTLLSAQVASTTNLLIGISDIRGDGRPDYRYQAHVLYGDSVSPPRVGVNGGAVTVLGTGFDAGVSMSVGDVTVNPLEISANQILLAAPAFSDGPQTISISDPVTGASTVMTDVLTFGAAATDTLVLLTPIIPSTPVGAQAAIPMSVQALAADGITPVAGATIGWGATNNLQLSACNSASSCTVTTDQNGDASTWLTPSATGTSTITATLAPGVYTSSQSVTTTLNATETASDIGVIPQYLWIAQGANIAIPLTARVLSDGAPKDGAKVNFSIVQGSGTLSATSVSTDSSGNATVNLSVSAISTQVQVSACVGSAPCQPFYVTPVPLANLNLQQVSGAGQVSTTGQAFQPIVVRVTDSSSPPNPVLAATVTFLSTVLRPGGSSSAGGSGETNSGNSGMPVILSVTQSSVTSDVNGLASIVPSSGSFSAPLEVDVMATAGTNATLNDVFQVVVPLPAASYDKSLNVPPKGNECVAERFEDGRVTQP
jgi:hypothetical protein